jgi:hypothetical protein
MQKDMSFTVARSARTEEIIYRERFAGQRSNVIVQEVCIKLREKNVLSFIIDFLRSGLARIVAEGERQSLGMM